MACVACERQLNPEAFPWRDKVKGTRRKKCKECARTYNREWFARKQKEARKQVQQLLAGYKCECCGENFVDCLRVIERSTAMVIDIAVDEWTQDELVRNLEALSTICLNCEVKLSEYTQEKRIAIVDAFETMFDAKDDLELDEPIADSPPTPTDHMPGTQAKIAVMRQRFSDGFPVMHDGDQKYDARDEMR